MATREYMTRTLSFVSLLFLFGCGNAGAYFTSNGGTTTGLHTNTNTVKTRDAYLSYTMPNSGVPGGPVEGTPIVFNNALYTIVGDSMGGASYHTFRIDSDLARPLVSVSAPGFAYISAFVSAGTVYVFGAVNSNQIQVMTSTNLLNWTAPVVVYSAPSGMGLYNTSVTADDQGFVMAVEVKDPAYPNPFVTHFLRSSDLISWILLPNVLVESGQTNCPTIRYLPGINGQAGYYYVLYLNWYSDANFTFITRSTDLASWQNGSGYPDGLTVPFAPSIGEGNNISDVDLVEFDGKTYFLFARGDQASWLELSTAIDPRPMRQYLEGFYP